MLQDRLNELNITIPEAAKPLAAYVPAILINGFVYTSGQLPLANGALTCTGKVGHTVSVEQAAQAARICAINCLSAAGSVLPSLDAIEQVVKVTVFISSAAGFTGQPEVANGASQLMLDIFGDKGKHARSAVGVAELPRDASVEVEMVFQVKG